MCLLVFCYRLAFHISITILDGTRALGKWGSIMACSFESERSLHWPHFLWRDPYCDIEARELGAIPKVMTSHWAEQNTTRKDSCNKKTTKVQFSLHGEDGPKVMVLSW